jgi:threonine 3-dehydrogenase
VIWRNDRSKLPPEIATLQEPFGNAVFATSEQDLAGRSVAVLGCGPIGLFTIGIARASGAAVVMAADRTPFRLGLAEKMGATRSSTSTRRRTRSAGSSSTTTATASTSSSRCPARRARSPTRSGSPATAAA